MAQLQPVRQAQGQVLLAFLDRWLDKFDSIGTPAARKLSALALCNILALPVPSVLDRLDGIAAHLTAVYFEVCVSCLQLSCKPLHLSSADPLMSARFQCS